VRHNTVHHIQTIPGPPVTCQPRRLALDRLAIVKAEFEAMLRDGTARRSESSWSSALHIMPKDNGWRPCGDYRALNARTIPDRYPVRHIHDYSHQLFSCSIFSKTDLVRSPVPRFRSTVTRLPGEPDPTFQLLSGCKCLNLSTNCRTQAPRQQQNWSQSVLCGQEYRRIAAPGHMLASPASARKSPAIQLLH
jgi:hypothetical protein